ncbi:unnamed protein product, partial [marine sediment metagenome]
NYIKEACQAVDIDPSTYRGWIRRGKIGKEPFSRFSRSIKKAKAKAIIRNVLIIQTAAKKRARTKKIKHVYAILTEKRTVTFLNE